MKSGLLFTVLISLFLLGGCNAGSQTILITSESEFNWRVLQSNKPVLLEFFKAACPTCVIQDAELDKVAQSYGDRVVVARMQIMNMAFISPYPKIKQEYKVDFVPVVILFVKGKEKERWVLNHSYDDFCMALNAVLRENSK